jgi:WD40 repeat protein
MRVLKGHTGKLRAVVFSPDGSKLATAGDAGVTKLWDAAAGRELATIRQPDADSATRADEKRVGRLAFSRDGKLLVTATQFVRVWEVDTASELPFPAGLGESDTLAMAFTPDDKLLVITRRWSLGRGSFVSSKILTWNRKSEKIEAPFGEAPGMPEAMAISASADLLAVAVQGHSKTQVHLWNLTSKKERRKIDLPPIPLSHLRASVQEVAFAPDGRTLAVAAGTQVFIFDLANGGMHGKIEVHAHQVASVAFAPRGRLIATASQDGTVRLWDAESLSERAAYNWEIGKLRGVAFNPDGMTVAAVGEKSTVVIWDVDEGLLE